MKKLIAVAVASLFATAAFAQQTTPGVPPAQQPAGDPGKFTKPKMDKSTSAKPADTSATADTSAKTPAEKKASRKAKRAAKVGEKPIN